VLALGTVAKRQGYDIQIIDSRVEDNYEDCINRLEAEPLCFGISAIIGYQVTEGLEIAKTIRKRFPKTPILWGGWFPTMLPELTVKSQYADIVVRGQGETTFLELLHCLSQSKPLSGVQSLTYKENGKVIHTPDRPLEDPTTFPPPNYELIDLFRYNSVQNQSINYQSSRGCPFRCKFCCTPELYGRSWKGLEPKRVLDELEYLASKYKINHIEFADDNFFNSKERAAQILTGMLERRINLTYTATVRINQLIKFDAATFALIKRTGCKTLYASSESGTDKILKVIQKDITVEQIRKMAELFARYKIPVRTTFMVALPEETHEDLKGTLRLSKELTEINKDIDVYYSFFLPLPGTVFFDDAKAQGLIKEPETLEGWAKCVPTDQRQFWLFLTKSDNLSTGKRYGVKKVAFYFWFGHFPRFARFISINKLFAPLKLLRKVCAYRFDHDIYAFPIEWWIFRLIWNTKLLLSEKN
jgi:radical SAM superfamily enzyme YgiQ (UPF0313 family)